MEAKKGTMAAADAKSAKRFFIGASILVGIIILIWVLPFNVDSAVGYAHAYFVRASSVWKIIAFILIAAWYGFLWGKSAQMITSPKDRGTPAIILLVGLFLILGCLSGWNFDLSGIQK